jgi:hypothetical protein
MVRNYGIGEWGIGADEWRILTILFQNQGFNDFMKAASILFN